MIPNSDEDGCSKASGSDGDSNGMVHQLPGTHHLSSLYPAPKHTKRDAEIQEASAGNFYGLSSCLLLRRLDDSGWQWERHSNAVRKERWFVLVAH